MKSSPAKRLYMRLYKARNRIRLSLLEKLRRDETRYDVLAHYSNGLLVCNCCGETTYEFLSIDHINGGGNQHRKALGSKYIYSFLRQNWPVGYQVLCHNCNMAKAFYKVCPHQIEREEVSYAETRIPETASGEGTKVLCESDQKDCPSDQ